jgi:protein-S-isoprenylcysteine O-methyltransferase Ste14
MMAKVHRGAVGEAIKVKTGLILSIGGMGWSFPREGRGSIMRSLTVRAYRALAIFTLVIAAAIFLAAGTVDYWQAWVFLLAYFAPSLAIVVYLAKLSPELLQRRMRGGPRYETGLAQKIIMSVVSVGFVALILVPALDRRFGWSEMSGWIALSGDALVLLGWLVMFIVFRANPWAASTIEVAEGQTVVSSGPYALMRHPMYAGAFFMLCGIPIALGSWWGLLPLTLLFPALVWRLLDEEKVLEKNLPGYLDYEATVRWRLIPRIW